MISIFYSLLLSEHKYTTVFVTTKHFSIFFYFFNIFTKNTCLLNFKLYLCDIILNN